MSSRSSAARIPRATSSQRVIPPKMLKKIERTCSSRVITSSASTTPSALPPPPRSQKFAGRPPACATTSTVDIPSPAPLARTPTPPARDPRLEALERIEVEPDQRVRALLRDLLDLDAALRREHEERLLCAAVEGDGEVVLARDVRRLLDPERADDVAVDVEAEDVARLRLGVGGIVRELHAAGLAAPPGQHLRLDDDRAGELLGRLARLLRRA